MSEPSAEERKPGHDSWKPLAWAWYVAAPSTALKKTPLPFVLAGSRRVLFRDENGKPHCLEDRCPHRNVPLSEGAVFKGQLQCGYHGWCFDGDGACRDVPGLVGTVTDLPSRRVTAFPTLEQDGFVWVAASAVTPAEPPARLPHLDDGAYTTVRRSVTLKGSLHQVAENALDVPHTAFLHGGLFRTAEKKNTIECIIRRTGTKAEAEYVGEPAPRGLIGALLAPGGGVVEHFDRFLLPCIAQVEYRLGAKSHLVSTSILTPVGPYETVLHALVSFRLPLPHWLIRPFVAPIVLRILNQDARMLALQSEAISHHGEQDYTSTALDLLAHEIGRLLAAAREGPPGATETRDRRVMMKT